MIKNIISFYIMKNNIQVSQISGSSRSDARSHVSLLLTVHIQPLASGSPREVPCRECTKDRLWMRKVSQSIQTGRYKVITIGTEKPHNLLHNFRETFSLNFSYEESNYFSVYALNGPVIMGTNP